MEAADEICAATASLRDLGGVIICDFIDLRYERHRRELEKKRLHDNFKTDRAKTRVLPHEPVRHYRNYPPAHAPQRQAQRSTAIARIATALGW